MRDKGFGKGKIPQSCDGKGLWDLYVPTSFSDQPHVPSSARNRLDDGERFGVVPSPLEDGGSSVPKRKHAADLLQQAKHQKEDEVKDGYSTNYQSKQQKGAKWEEDEVKEDLESVNQCKQADPHSARANNKNEKIQQQIVNERLKILRELIPNCNTNDQVLILKDAIKYARTLENQFNMMLLGIGISASYTMMMMKQLEQQGIQLPTTNLPSFPTIIPSNNVMGMPDLFSSLSYSTRPLGLPNPCFLPSMDWMQRYMTSLGLPTVQPNPNQVVPPNQVVSSNPNQVVPSQSVSDMDNESCLSTSTEWSSTSDE